jgi:hypothetical protein
MVARYWAYGVASEAISSDQIPYLDARALCKAQRSERLHLMSPSIQEFSFHATFAGGSLPVRLRPSHGPADQ